MEINLGDFQNYIHKTVDGAVEQIVKMSFHGIPYKIIDIKKGQLTLSRPLKIIIKVYGTVEEIEELLVKLNQQNLLYLGKGS